MANAQNGRAPYVARGLDLRRLRVGQHRRRVGAGRGQVRGPEVHAARLPPDLQLPGGDDTAVGAGRRAVGHRQALLLRSKRSMSHSSGNNVVSK